MANIMKTKTLDSNQNTHRWILFILFILATIVLLFAVRNLPWSFRGYDQAKQGYVSFEIVKLGHWLYQHTPQGFIATKPPFAGWLSVLIYYLSGGSWHAAWRLPSFLSALILLYILYKEGNRILPMYGGILAAGAFGLNMLTIRISTLIRTDMLLTLEIFLIGWMILRHIQNDTPWSFKEKFIVFLLFLAAQMTKGPTVFAFFIPGMVVYHIICRQRHEADRTWSGWWTWAIPFAIFIAWVTIGAITDQAFYDQVVRREFLGNFIEVNDVYIGGSGPQTFDRQPFWFYIPHIIHKFAPWSLLILYLAIMDSTVRKGVAQNKDSLWLTWWIIGSFIIMSCVPGKRVDRLYPIIPPACLLMVQMISYTSRKRFQLDNLRTTTTWFLLGSLVVWGAYTAYEVHDRYQHPHNNLIPFGKEVQQLANENQWNVVVVGPDLEEILLYTDQPLFTPAEEAWVKWQSGKANALIMSDSFFGTFTNRTTAYDIVLKAYAGNNDTEAFYCIRRNNNFSQRREDAKN